MKTRIRSVLAAFVGVCLMLVLSPNLLQETGLGWLIPESLTGPHNFYFAQRQWLADARTIAAAIHFLYESSTTTQNMPVEVVSIPPLPPRRLIITNFVGMAHPGAESRLQGV